MLQSLHRRSLHLYALSPGRALAGSHNAACCLRTLLLLGFDAVPTGPSRSLCLAPAMLHCFMPSSSTLVKTPPKRGCRWPGFFAAWRGAGSLAACCTCWAFCARDVLKGFRVSTLCRLSGWMPLKRAAKISKIRGASARRRPCNQMRNKLIKRQRGER